MFRFTILLFAGCLAFVCVTNASADEPKPDASSKKSLDNSLLDDLDSDLLDGLDDPVSPTSTDDALDENSKDDDKDLLDQLGDGEDVEIGEEADPLTRIAERMRTAEHLIADRDTSDKTQSLQKEILEDLAALIDVQKARAAQAGNQRQRSGSGNTAREAGTSAGPERSTPRLGKVEVVQNEELASQKDLYKKTWGSLPKRLVEQMLNSNVESFLPKYSKLIEEYFIRLAEEDESR